MTPPRAIPRERRDVLGEGLLWSARENAVYWTDILGRRVNRLRLADGRVDSWEVPGTIGWVIERADAPGFVAGLDRRVVALTLDPLTIETIADPDRDGNRMNDAKADAAGRIWFGTMALDGARPSGAFYRLDRDGGVARVDAGYRIANGPAIAEDGRTVFHTDSGERIVYRFAVAADGSLGAREVFIRFEDGWGDPDGMTLDAEGGLWIACWGAGCVTRFTPEGARDRSIALPASQISNCIFAGEALDRMFVTSASDGVDEPEAGALFEIDPGCTGTPTHLSRMRRAG
ncbi:SMP-30/gluconolactonase/LRE family protein [Sphingomonas immobilis]|uniref:SMP-30/gluconolactonase/LRE family protein n=1 Tax=Sphingomonas immobilis TaxID=3063997 RepID=A0ABT8ZT69_9SPHN|nr:SMP-30/gluconolactonase/LRE family protein [Sphingomonas sp. CA1-15]MDO7840762.1 SMP-30/gluconolactonase/LRE family protein [Sphingomonas sp. CA1-15]